MSMAPHTIERAQRRLAAAGGKHIGDLIAWNCERIDIERARAREIFGAEHLEELIADMDPATALSRAAAEVKRPAGIIVRPFARPKGDTSAAVGIYLQETREGEGGDQYVCGARCRVDRTTGQVIALPPDGGAPLDVAIAHAEAMAQHANHLIGFCETKDISAAMVATAKALSGVPLRDRGGFYLLPPSTCGRWAKLKPGLEAIGVEPIRIEMRDAPDNVAAVKAAAQGALEADIAHLITDLEKAATEGMRQHAIERRIEICRELSAKTELYRSVLAGTADKLTDKLGALRTQFQLHLNKTDECAFSLPENA